MDERGRTPVRKVLLMIHRLQRGGGTETHVRLLATRLAREGWHVGVFTAGGPWVPYFRKHGIQIHMDDRDESQRLQALKQLVSREGYQVIHAHDSTSCRMAAKLHKSNVNVVMTIHGLYMFDASIQKAARKADTVIVVSSELADSARSAGVRDDSLVEIPNGISSYVFHPARSTGLRSKKGIPNDAFVIGYAGRFTYAKGELGKRIIRALYPYVEKRADVYVLIAGRDSETQVKSRHKRLHILGHVDDMAAFYTSCDVVIGTGRVALESSACGVPTIAVGEMKYIGRLIPGNVGHAAASNFGDHGKKFQTWRDATLHSAVESVRTAQKEAKASARSLSSVIRKHYSADQMCKSVIHVYTSFATKKGKTTVSSKVKAVHTAFARHRLREEYTPAAIFSIGGWWEKVEHCIDVVY